jgi:hypothetical protein
MNILSTCGPEEEWKLATVFRHAHEKLSCYERRVSRSYS